MAQESVYERLTEGNRKQRKDLQRRLHSDNPGLDVGHANAAGIDVGNECHFVWAAAELFPATGSDTAHPGCVAFCGSGTCRTRLALFSICRRRLHR